MSCPLEFTHGHDVLGAPALTVGQYAMLTSSDGYQPMLEGVERAGLSAVGDGVG